VKPSTSVKSLHRWLPAQARRDDRIGALVRTLREDSDAPTRWDFESLFAHLLRRPDADLEALWLAEIERSYLEFSALGLPINRKHVQALLRLERTGCDTTPSGRESAP
jgi:hypothetical protein